MKRRKKLPWKNSHAPAYGSSVPLAEPTALSIYIKTCTGLPARREWAMVSLFFFVVTIAYLWPAVWPLALGHHIKSIDASLTAAIASHVAHAITGQADFWSFPPFYPHRNTLCLSEPLLLQSLFSIPFLRFMGPIATQNLYLYFCWWSTAMAAFAFLRHRGLDTVSACLGAFVISFSPDRYWHLLAGHTHLHFQAGFGLVLLALERLLMSPGSKWGAVLVLALALQLFAGFYITVLFLVWIVWLAPVSIAYGMKGLSQAGGTRHLIRRQWSVLLPGLGAIACVMALIARTYSEYGKGLPNNSLENLTFASADWRGYLLPPLVPGQYLTAAGWALSPFLPRTDLGENSQWIGSVPISLALCAAVLYLVRAVLKKPGLSDRLLLVALTGAALTALLLSFGPFLHGLNSQRVPVGARLPMAYLYAWVEPLRFFRAPARFSIVVQWSVGFAAAFGLWTLRQNVSRLWRLLVTGIFAILAAVEFFPLSGSSPVSGEPDSATQRLVSDHGKPFVHYPRPELGKMLSQVAWHQVPTVEGYSGYSPGNVEAELEFWNRSFPSEASQLLLQRWNVANVMVRGQASEQEISGFAKLWSTDSQRSFYGLRENKASFHEFLARQRAKLGLDQAPAPKTIIGDQQPRSPQFAASEFCQPIDQNTTAPGYINQQPYAPYFVYFPTEPLNPVLYTHLRIQISIDNWYDMRETGTIFWNSDNRTAFDGERVMQFTIPADGEMHEILVPLGEHIAWITADPVRTMRLDFGSRTGNRVTIFLLQFEQREIQWVLPSRP